MFHTYEGINYIYILIPIFMLHYLEQPLLSTLQAMNKAKINMIISLINMIIRTIGLIILCNFKIGMLSLLITLSLNIIFTCFYSYNKINKIIKKLSYN